MQIALCSVLVVVCYCVFFFKQKTAYEMRISDWSSDVCSSDLLALVTHNGLAVTAVSAWMMDGLGRLYAQTEHGPGLIAGRDLPALIPALRTDQGQSLILAMEHLGAAESVAILEIGRASWRERVCQTV